MGYAKYSEDIIKIRDENLKLKKIKKFLKSSIDDHKKNKNDDKKLILIQKLTEIKISLIQIQVWMDFYLEITNKFQAKELKEYIEFRLEELEDLKEEYYNLFFSEDFKDIRESITVDKKKIKKDFLKLIKEDFLNVFCEIFIKLRNKTIEDSIQLRKFYSDLDDYIEKILKRNVKKPYLKSILDCYLDNNKNLNMEICSKCKKKTYKNIPICINCDYDRGE